MCYVHEFKTEQMYLNIICHTSATMCKIQPPVNMIQQPNICTL